MADALTVPEAADRLGVSRWTLRRHINATGEVAPGVRVFRIGSRDLVSKIQLEEFLHTGSVPRGTGRASHGGDSQLGGGTSIPSESPG
jgi:excisionase family DNA binding protein